MASSLWQDAASLAYQQYNRIAVNLPEGMPPGAVVGKGGGNIRLLQQRSGARVEVSNDPVTRRSNNCVIISGTSQAVQVAKQLLDAQIEAFLASGGAYPHPAKVLYSLSTCFGNDSQQRVRFAVRQDEVSRITGRYEQLYVLQPMEAGSVVTATADAQGSPEGTFYLHNQQHLLLQEVLAAARKAVAHKPAFDGMKLSFNLGKQFMYNGPSPATCWTIKELQSKHVPRDFKCVYSNAVLPEMLPQLRSWLEQHGITQVDSKDTASVHMGHRATATGYTLSFIKHSDKPALRKAKSENSKLAFMTLLADPQQPDWRAKLLAQYHFKPDSNIAQKLTEVASQVQLSTDGRLSFPPLDAYDMYVDSERPKHKTVYQGVLRDDHSPAATASTRSDSSTHDATGYRRLRLTNEKVSTTIKVTFSEVKLMTGRGSVSYEVTGTSPAVNELLLTTLQSGRYSAQQEEELLAHLQNMLCFAREFVTAARVTVE